MDLKRFFLAFVVLMFAFRANAEIKTTTLTAEDHGVLGAMSRMHCTDPHWLERTLILSGIPDSQTTRLPEGTPIVIPSECDTESPNAADIAATKMFFARQSASQDLSKLQGMIASLNNELSKAQATIASLTEKNVNLAQQLVQAQESIKKVSAVMHQTGAPPLRGWRTAFIVTFILLLVLLVFEMWTATYLERRTKELANLQTQYAVVSDNHHVLESLFNALQGKYDELKWVYEDLHKEYSKEQVSLSQEYRGKVYDFPDTTDQTVGCPVGCHEKKIKKHPMNMRQHLDTHRELRLVKVEPEEMRRLLATAIR
jgi:hypothetical protein